MSPGHDERRPGGGGVTSSRPAQQQDHSQGTADLGQEQEDALFAASTSVGAYGVRSTTFRIPDDEPAPDYRRGPGAVPRQASGPARSRTSARQHADPEWVAAAVRRIAALAALGGRFEAADVRKVLPPSVSGVAALGAIFAEAAARGTIVPAGYGPSRSPSRRGSAVRFWAGR